MVVTRSGKRVLRAAARVVVMELEVLTVAVSEAQAGLKRTLVVLMANRASSSQAWSQSVALWALWYLAAHLAAVVMTMQSLSSMQYHMSSTQSSADWLAVASSCTARMSMILTYCYCSMQKMLPSVDPPVLPWANL